jgi:signal peptidase I
LPSLRHLTFGRNPRLTAVRILVLIGVAAVLLNWVLIPVRAEGISMEPTYTSGRLILVNRLAYRFSTPDRGDIVAIRLAGPHVLYIKRIVALPGERVRITEGEVAIDGRPLIEPYVATRRRWNVPEVLLGADEYFVIGDNRGMNAADHDFGRVDRARILGRVLF